MVRAAIAKRIASAPKASSDQPHRGHGLRDQSGGDRRDGDDDGQTHPRRAHVGAREPDHSSQPGNRDGRYPAAPALGRQGHHHREGDEDQEEDEAVGLADPLDELQARLARVAQTAKSAARLCGLVRHPSTFGRTRAAPSLARASPPSSDRLNTLDRWRGGCAPEQRGDRQAEAADEGEVG